jgi:ribosomal protein L12E/L44/L45/RPP1/RPP2
VAVNTLLKLLEEIIGREDITNLIQANLHGRNEYPQQSGVGSAPIHDESSTAENTSEDDEEEGDDDEEEDDDDEEEDADDDGGDAIHPAPVTTTIRSASHNESMGSQNHHNPNPVNTLHVVVNGNGPGDGEQEHHDEAEAEGHYANLDEIATNSNDDSTSQSEEDMDDTIEAADQEASNIYTIKIPSRNIKSMTFLLYKKKYFPGWIFFRIRMARNGPDDSMFP